MTNATCRQPCQIKTHLSQVHSHSSLRLSSYSRSPLFIATFTLFHKRVHTCKHATCNDRQRIDDHTTSTIRLLCCQRGIYELVGDLHGENTFVESPTRCVTSAKWARVGTRVGIPRIAAHSTARTFTGYVGPSQGTREHRFLIVSVPDTRRSCHVILHCTEESESEGGQVDFHRTLDRRSPSRTTILPIRYRIYWKLGRLRILFASPNWEFLECF